MPNEFSNIEYLSMIKFYVVEKFNANAARRLYSDPQHLNGLQRRGIPNPRIPSNKTFIAVWQRLLDYGQFCLPIYMLHKNTTVTNNKCNDKLAARVAEYFKTNPCSSIRKAGRHFNVSGGLITRLLKNESEEESPPHSKNDISEKDEVLANVYHYFKKERDERADKTVSTMELRHRTARVCGVPEHAVRRVLKLQRAKENPDLKPRKRRPKKASTPPQHEQQSASDDEMDGEEAEMTLAQLKQRQQSQDGAERPATTQKPNHKRRGRKRKANTPPPEHKFNPLSSDDETLKPDVTDATVENGLQQEEQTEEVVETLIVKIEPREYEDSANHLNGSLEVKIENPESSRGSTF
ncbi:unnamed protein product [Spodoptera littoralis]|uniref:Uncharacterized protein n=1 Tax=Spodoptera littoralis TaxID=7109 RepID=A0A9P0I889_SPOLI|nr:unnamed protein product [Spodoptera littoralis]CAH1642037.1 unnamed protein product [Spodoptera littoralis]